MALLKTDIKITSKTVTTTFPCWYLALFSRGEPVCRYCMDYCLVSVSWWCNHVLPTMMSRCKNDPEINENITNKNICSISFLVGIRTFWRPLDWHLLHTQLLKDYKNNAFSRYLSESAILLVGIRRPAKITHD